MEDDLSVQSFDIGDTDRQLHGQKDDDWQDKGEDEYDEEELDDLGFAEVKAKSVDDVTGKAFEPCVIFFFMDVGALADAVMQRNTSASIPPGFNAFDRYRSIRR